jgi:hypothetical protein
MYVLNRSLSCPFNSFPLKTLEPPFDTDIRNTCLGTHVAGGGTECCLMDRDTRTMHYDALATLCGNEREMQITCHVTTPKKPSPTFHCLQ